MRKKLIWLPLVVTGVLSLVAVTLSAIALKTKPTANEIYKNCLYNVVEVKSENKGTTESFGTGEIISFDGKIVTNAHVVTYENYSQVKEYDDYFIRFAFEDEYRRVTLEKYDCESDIAVLKLVDCSCLEIKPVKTGDSNNVKSGDRVYAVGNASNYGIGIFEGIISIPLIKIEYEEITKSVIQCDLTIASGNSGGALLNDDGELIGITTFRTKDGSGNVIYGIVYCIPINEVLQFIK